MIFPDPAITFPTNGGTRFFPCHRLACICHMCNSFIGSGLFFPLPSYPLREAHDTFRKTSAHAQSSLQPRELRGGGGRSIFSKNKTCARFPYEVGAVGIYGTNGRNAADTRILFFPGKGTCGGVSCTKFSRDERKYFSGPFHLQVGSDWFWPGLA